MANELTLSASLSFSKNGGTIKPSAVSNLRFDVTGNVGITSVQNISTAGENVQVGEVSSIGYVLVKNLSTTGHILVGTSAAQQIKVRAGGVALFEWNTGTLWAISDTGDGLSSSSDVEFTLIAL